MSTKNEIATGFKGFNADWTCNGFKFEIGQTFEQKGKIELCSSEFHFCENALDTFRYYPPTGKFAAVEAEGMDSKMGDDSKRVCQKIIIKSEISLHSLVQSGAKFILSRVDFKNAPATNTGNMSAATNTGNMSAATNTGNMSAATNTGDWSAATNTGDRSAATNTGYMSAATNTGNMSAATNTGYMSAATNTGDMSAATNTGDRSAATNTGDMSAATNTGDRSAATNTGDMSAATNTGNMSAATNTGNWSAATVGGKESIAVVTGKESKASGVVGCWIVLTERDCNWKIIEVKAFKVDDKKIKAGVFYKLENGKAVES